MLLQSGDLQRTIYDLAKVAVNRLAFSQGHELAPHGAALASDPERARWNQRSVTSGQLAMEYGFTDLDGSRPDVWRYTQAVETGASDVDPGDYR